MHALWIPDLPVVEKIVRAASVYIFLLVAFRLGGKRQLGQMSSFDLVVLLIISNVVQNATIGNDNSVAGGIVGAITLLVLNAVVVRFLYDHRKLDEIIEGDEELLIENGQVKMDRLRSELIRLPQLETAARKQGFDSLDEIDKAVLEPGGTLVFLRKKPTPDETRQRELLERLERLCDELTRLRDEMTAGAPAGTPGPAGPAA